MPFAGIDRAHAQEMGTAISQIVTIDRQSLFSKTLYGRRVVDTVEIERRRLAAENREIEEDLAAEERSLTEQRDTMTSVEFRKLATAFDEKVQALRAEGKSREEEFVRTLEAEQSAFFERIGPILGQLVRELGAVVIIDRRAILLTTQNIDITSLAIARIDRDLGDGSLEADQPPTTPAGESGSGDKDGAASPDNTDRAVTPSDN